MLDLDSLLVFSGAAILLLIIPGPAVLYIVARSAAQGRRAGLASVAGIHVGTLVHIAAAVGGLSALLVASATAFTVVKLAGAAYLIFLGIVTILRARDAAVASTEDGDRSIRRIFIDGVVVNVLNPKTAVFFLAFAPQFVDVDAGSTSLQIAMLGLVFIVLGVVSDGLYAIAGAWVGQRLGNRRSRGREFATGAAYVGLGTAVALIGGSSST